MSHTYTKCLVHAVFATAGRRNMIAPDIAPRLWAYVGGIARTNDLTALAVGGTADHVHILLGLTPTVTLAKALQLIKAGSSKWLHDAYPTLREFAWQEGYGAFTIGVSQVDDTVRYIETQAEHHRTRSFDEEFTLFLKRHGLDRDPHDRGP